MPSSRQIIMVSESTEVFFSPYWPFWGTLYPVNNYRFKLWTQFHTTHQPYFIQWVLYKTFSCCTWRCFNLVFTKMTNKLCKTDSSKTLWLRKAKETYYHQWTVGSFTTFVSIIVFMCSHVLSNFIRLHVFACSSLEFPSGIRICDNCMIWK
jgi:hypothetical protein